MPEDLSFSANRPAAEKKTLKSDPNSDSPSGPISQSAPVLPLESIKPNNGAVVATACESAQEPEPVSAPVPVPSVQAAPEPEAFSAVGSGVDDFVGQWPVLAPQMPLSGMAQQCVLQAACLGFSGDELRLLVPTDALAKGPHLDRVRQVLTQSFGAEVKLTVSVGEVAAGLSAQWFAQEVEKARLAAAVQTLDEDPFVQALIQSFGAQIVPGSIKSVTSTPHTPNN